MYGHEDYLEWHLPHGAQPEVRCKLLLCGAKTETSSKEGLDSFLKYEPLNKFCIGPVVQVN